MTSRVSRPRAHATLERQAIGFTISLYLFIMLSMLALHFLAPSMQQVTDTAEPAFFSVPAHTIETER